jgi:hypothetical protein
MSETGRLAAILAVDVTGYSRLMGEDEAGTARAVREHREAAQPIVASLGGCIVKTVGDGVLLEFPSVVAAVECAIAIQKLMVGRNADTPESQLEARADDKPGARRWLQRNRRPPWHVCSQRGPSQSYAIRTTTVGSGSPESRSAASTRLRPKSFARYRAPSALEIMSVRLHPCSGAVAAPKGPIP